MNNYLAKYSKFLNSSKEGVNITESQTYISEDNYYINEIISYFEPYIDVHDILSLVESKRFYKGHNIKSKFLLLTQFYEIIYNYAKNLLLNYEVYSTKIIKSSTPHIQSCLVYIPKYKNYLNDLLGYVYDSDTDKWSIDENNQILTVSNLAGVCILCSYGSKILTDLMVERCLSGDNESQKQDTNSDNEYNEEFDDALIEIKNDTWECTACSFINNISSKNCLMCFNSAEVPNQIRIENNNVTPKIALNNNNNNNNNEENILQFETDESSMDENSCSASENGELISKGLQSSIDIKRRKTTWKCEFCSSTNENNLENCRNCYKVRKNIEELEKKPNIGKELINKIGKYERECSECVRLQRKCENCTRKRKANGYDSDEGSSIRNPEIPKKNNLQIETDESNNSVSLDENSCSASENGELISKGFQSPIDIKRRKTTWKCEFCSSTNENNLENCRNCYKVRKNIEELEKKPNIGKELINKIGKYERECSECVRLQRKCENCTRKRKANGYDSDEGSSIRNPEIPKKNNLQIETDESNNSVSLDENSCSASENGELISKGLQSSIDIKRRKTTWKCEFCSSTNENNLENCRNCYKVRKNIEELEKKPNIGKELINTRKRNANIQIRPEKNPPVPQRNNPSCSNGNKKIEKVSNDDNNYNQWICVGCSKLQRKCEVCSGKIKPNKEDNIQSSPKRKSPIIYRENPRNYSQIPNENNQSKNLLQTRGDNQKQPIVKQSPPIGQTGRSRSPQKLINENKKTNEIYGKCKKCKREKELIHHKKCKSCQSLRYRIKMFLICGA